MGSEMCIRDRCLHCADTRSGDVVPRPLGETVHGTAPNEVVHFDYLYVGESGPQASQGSPEDGGFRYILVIMDDLSNFVVDEQTWEPFKEIFEAAPEFLAKELRKLRVTRAIAARIKRIWYSIVIFSTSWRFLRIKLVARIYSSNAPWGCCDEMRLSVEFVTVGFLGICRQYCCD